MKLLITSAKYKWPLDSRLKFERHAIKIVIKHFWITLQIRKANVTALEWSENGIVCVMMPVSIRSKKWSRVATKYRTVNDRFSENIYIIIAMWK